MIRIVDVTQHYGVQPVLKRISLDVPDGTRTVIIGPNGMGKTTLLGVMAGALSPQHGHVEINGLVRRSNVENEREIRRQTVYLPDRCWLPKDRTGREFIQAVGRLYDIADARLLDHAERLLRLFDLNTLADASIRSYSAGQQKKIALCSALITEAPILLLDEPFSGGLDPAGILALKRLLKHLSEQEGRTVVLTTPVPELVEEIADRLIILQHGRVLWDGSLRDLHRQANGQSSLGEILQRMVFPETLQNIDAYFAGEER